MNCLLCNQTSKDKYCEGCKHIRCVYLIHKLLEKIAINEKFNKDTLTLKNLKNIEEYDLKLLQENEILIKDRFNNYKWTTIEDINNYLTKHDKTGKKLIIKDERKKHPKKDKELTIDEVILIIEKNYNITDTLNEEKLSKNLKTNKSQTKKIIQELQSKKLIKKTFYGEYRLNYQEIIKYKKKNNLTEDKIKKLNNVKKTQETKTKTTKKKKASENRKDSKKKSTNKIKYVKKTSQTDNKKINDNINKQSKKKDTNKTQSVEDKIIPQIRKYINEELIILPRNVADNDMTINQLYDEFKESSQSDISQKDFQQHFHRIINTYPHARHNTIEGIKRYNVKSRNTPQIILNNIQKDNNKFTYNDKCQVELKENTLKVDTQIKEDEILQLYNLIVYTYENIIEYTYEINEDKIHIRIIYDLNNESPDLWLKFLKSYNLQ